MGLSWSRVDSFEFNSNIKGVKPCHNPNSTYSPKYVSDVWSDQSEALTNCNIIDCCKYGCKARKYNLMKCLCFNLEQLIDVVLFIIVNIMYWIFLLPGSFVVSIFECLLLDCCKSCDPFKTCGSNICTGCKCSCGTSLLTCDFVINILECLTCLCCFEIYSCLGIHRLHNFLANKYGNGLLDTEALTIFDV